MALAHDCSNSSALAMELLQSCAKPLIWYSCWKNCEPGPFFLLILGWWSDTISNTHNKQSIRKLCGYLMGYTLYNFSNKHAHVPREWVAIMFRQLVIIEKALLGHNGGIVVKLGRLPDFPLNTWCDNGGGIKHMIHGKCEDLFPENVPAVLTLLVLMLEYSQESEVRAMAADALALCITSTSATMVLIM